IDKFWGEYKHVLEWAMNEGDIHKFLQYLKLEFIDERIYVSTPKGEYKELPLNSTVVDFAYSIHSDIGDHCSGAKINGKMSPIDTVLKNEDVVDILTAENQSPKVGWLEFVITSRARSRIKKWIKEHDKQLIEKGKQIFDEMIKNFEDKYDKKIMLSDVKSNLTHWGLKNMEKLYENLGYGTFSSSKLIEYFRKTLIDTRKKGVSLPSDSSSQTQDETVPETGETSISKVIVDGFDSSQLKFAKCCMPVEGDEIVGFVTYNHKISVHKKDCPTIARFLNNDERILYAYWDTEQMIKKIPVYFEIKAEDKFGIKNEILKKLVKTNQEVGDIELKNKRGGFVVGRLTIFINNINAIEEVLRLLSTIEGIIEVKPKTKYI
ncbi:MAG: TGS domain-containing protein, partial [bacterium]|nr:TGS domain-containing protein [bacterium]